MNRFKYTILTVLFLLICIHSIAQGQEGYFLHTVSRGQSLYSIASMYHISIDDIIKLNPGSEKKIRTGETLRIPQKQQSTANSSNVSVRYHTIQAGETLYRLTQIYKMSAEVICKANPGLSADNFRTGQVILIPQITSEYILPTPTEESTKKNTTEKKSPCREMHKVKRKETIFGISREYGISEAELIAANPELKKGKLKRGTFICIPHKREIATNKPNVNTSTQTPTNEELFDKNLKATQKLTTIRAALILPFNLDNVKNESTLMVEYYEGLLLAVDSLKRQGVSIDLFVYDSGDRNQSITPLLQKSELKKMDIIFGPGHSEHIKPLADFAKENNIHLVIPFTSKDSEVFTNPYVYQINTPQSYLYSQVYEHFLERFKKHNIIFVQSEDGNDKEEFINGFKQELENKHINYHTLPMFTATDATSAIADSIKLAAILSTEKPNIFIPTSGSNITLIKLLPTLQLIARRNAEQENSPQIHLFGYPEWQKYTNDHLQAFYEIDTYFYSSFYTNNLLPSSIQFNRNYRHWYNKEMAHTFPKYGMLGFDTSYFFLKGLSRYGNNLEANLGKIQVTPVQTGFKFERVNTWGGFINKKVFFIHMTPNHELIKIDFE